jgi:hypothetical protein
MSRVRPLNARAGGTEPQARGTPCGLQPARERPCLRRPARTSARLHALSEWLTQSSATPPRHRAVTGAALCEVAQPRTPLRPDRATTGRPRARGRVSAVIWAQVRDRVPDTAAIAPKVRESSGTRRRNARARFRWKPTTFALGGPATENRGVPGSSPGLATSRTRSPAWILDSLVSGGIWGEPLSPVHETVVVSPHRVAARVALRNACNCSDSDPPASQAPRRSEAARRPFPAFSALIPVRRRPVVTARRAARMCVE